MNPSILVKRTRARAVWKLLTARRGLETCAGRRVWEAKEGAFPKARWRSPARFPRREAQFPFHQRDLAVTSRLHPAHLSLGVSERRVELSHVFWVETQSLLLAIRFGVQSALGLWTLAGGRVCKQDTPRPPAKKKNTTEMASIVENAN